MDQGWFYVFFDLDKLDESSNANLPMLLAKLLSREAAVAVQSVGRAATVTL